MKKSICVCFVLCLCLLFSACSKPELPEESDLSVEESGASTEPAPAPEDPDAKAVRAYLEELLTHEPESGSTEWLTAERAEAIRESVKRLKTPILTEDDVLRIAERAVAVCFSACRERQAILLPACGMLEAVYSDTKEFSRYSEYEEANNALLAYTFYLFTPPDYLFWGSEIWNEGWYPSNDAGADPAYALCLPFAPSAADDTSRQGALKAIREQQSCIRLYPINVSDGERPLDFAQCGAPDLLRGGVCTVLDLLELAQWEDVTLPEEFRTLYEEAYVRDRLHRILACASGAGVPHGTYECPNGDAVAVYQLLSAEDAAEIRERVEQLSKPILTRRDAKEMLLSLLDSGAIANLPLLLLPGIDGAEDVLLPSGVESLEEALQLNEKDADAKAYGAFAYLIDLFIPSEYRYMDLTAHEGTYYRLQSDNCFLLVTKKNMPYIVADIYLVPLDLAA